MAAVPSARDDGTKGPPVAVQPCSARSSLVSARRACSANVLLSLSRAANFVLWCNMCAGGKAKGTDEPAGPLGVPGGVTDPCRRRELSPCMGERGGNFFQGRKFLVQNPVLSREAHALSLLIEGPVVFLCRGRPLHRAHVC